MRRKHKQQNTIIEFIELKIVVRLGKKDEGIECH